MDKVNEDIIWELLTSIPGEQQLSKILKKAKWGEGLDMADVAVY